MKVSCPSCGARITVREDAPGGRQTCPACMTSFALENEHSAHPEMEIEVQGPRGEMLGTMDRYAIRQAIYTGHFSGREKVRIGSNDWEPVLERPEFSDLLQLLGVDVEAIRLSTQNIKGWKKDVSARRTRNISAVTNPAIAIEPEPEQAMATKDAIWEELPLPIALGGLAVALILVIGLVYLWVV